MRPVNLIPRHRLETRQRRGRIQLWCAVCVTYALAVLAVWFGFRAVQGNANRAVTDELAQIQAQITENSKQITAAQLGLAEAQANLQANREVASQPDWSVLMALLANHLGDATVLSSCRIDPLVDETDGVNGQGPATGVALAVAGANGGAAAAPGAAGRGAAGSDASAGPGHYMLRLSGMGQSQAAVSQFVLRLEQMNLFERVKLIDTRREPYLRGQGVSFRLECLLNARGGNP